LQLVKDSRVTLDYEVARLGPSGIGEVELYITRDDGQTWYRMPGESTSVGAAPTTETPGMPATLRRSLTVELPEEGVYGLYLVVRSGAKLGKPPPGPGDLPQLRVEVDRTPPTATLYPFKTEPHRRNTIVLLWQASDRNLAANPITLEWSDRPGGPWQPIGPRELPNAPSQYGWQLPPGIPARVYLRLSARDTAGNVGLAETTEPVLIDLNEPEVVRFSVSPGR
jgi:hypothetical protein